MKIFLTGATGFLGTHVVQVLRERGHSLKALVRSSSSVQKLKEQKVELIRGELPQDASLSGALSDADAVIHIAGLIKSLSKEEFFRVNTQGTAYLVEQVLNAGPRPRIFLHVSTVAVVDPRRGEDFCAPPETGPALSHYGESKRQAELALRPLRNQVQTLILRPPVLYGPHDREVLALFRMIGRGLAPMYRGGKNKISICYGPEVARAVADLVEKPPRGDPIYCLDDGDVHSWRSLSEAIARTMNRKPCFLPIRDPLMYGAALVNQLWARLRRRPDVFTLNKMRELRQARWVCGYEHLNRDTGWKSSVPLDTGLDKTYQFYRQEGWI